ncbi:MAG: hypothetical protein HBSAPP03_26790 [Phycisphaerae bacterium]|nr:MAG: hypothetical protein HBSAPP03_26790 [Phycisphaerae bacterium]
MEAGGGEVEAADRGRLIEASDGVGRYSGILCGEIGVHDGGMPGFKVLERTIREGEEKCRTGQAKELLGGGLERRADGDEVEFGVVAWRIDGNTQDGSGNHKFKHDESFP